MSQIPARTYEEMLMLHERMVESILGACKQFGVPSPSIQWSNRMTRAAGTASKKGIKLSIPLLRTASDDFCIEVAIHEAAHYIDFKFRGKSDHGHEWRKLMTILGYPNAERCHTLDRSHLHRYEIICRTCKKSLAKYTREPAASFLSRRRSACCHAELGVKKASIEAGH
ncbi:MAG TPA: SprT-like domain-containing protein [Rhodothermales bacterium]|nr:SprT-like domain-containing protein [Rhodothermales bacterium]HRR09218.1 SprT-like domain-containing protein [Rhodothermales bacterium]